MSRQAQTSPGVRPLCGAGLYVTTTEGKKANCLPLYINDMPQEIYKGRLDTVVVLRLPF